MVTTSKQILRSLFIVVSSLSNWCLWTAYGSGSVSEPILFHVGVILHFGDEMGGMSNRCISIAVEDFYNTHDNYLTKVVLHTEDSNDVFTAVLAAKELLEEKKVQAIVGPQTSAEADFIVELGNKKLVPVVSFSATSPSISRNQMPYFVRMTQNDTYQLNAIASLVLKFEWKDVILVYEDSDYGSEIIPSLIDIFKNSKVRVPHKTAISALATDDQILEEVRKLSEMQTRVFIVHMPTRLGVRFFMKVKEIGLMTHGNAWIITEEMTSVMGSLDSDTIASMHGVLGLKPHIIGSKKLKDFHDKMSEKYFNGLETWDDKNIFCLRAYDTIWALAESAERVHRNQSLIELTENENISVGDTSTSVIGPQLLEEILNSKFQGLSGDIHLIQGQLHHLNFQIINVVPEGETEIGFWIPLVGLSRQPDGTLPSDLGTIRWPGGSTYKPQGWVPNGKKLKIGYPQGIPFKDFVGISSDGSVAGFCIDVFKAVMDNLPYKVSYEFVPFQKIYGESGSNYNDLVQLVGLQNYDAAVGDITITANRSEFVDFSIAYTTGGIAMVIPIKYEKIVFGIDWFAGILSYIIILMFIIIWFFKHGRVDKIEKLITSEWKSLSFLLNQVKKAPGEHLFVALTLNLIWIGLLIPVYFNLLLGDKGQLLTVEAVDLIKSGEFVGCQKGSYVQTVLEQLEFEKSKIRVYNSPEEYDKALRKGSKNGGVAAIFDEIPYIMGFLSKFCDKYRRVGILHRMEGFGFVFPRGSHLVPDVSKVIIDLAESGELVNIEQLWFESEGRCHDPPKKKSNYLSLGKIRWPFRIMLVLWLFMMYHICMRFTMDPKTIETLQDDRKQYTPISEEYDASSAVNEIISQEPKSSDEPEQFDHEESDSQDASSVVTEIISREPKSSHEPKQSDPEESNQGGLITPIVLAPLQETLNPTDNHEESNLSDEGTKLDSQEQSQLRESMKSKEYLSKS